MADNETIADIRKDAEAKFRELVEAYMQRRAAFQTTVGAMQAFNTVFDRLDAAWRRECAKIEADALAVGGIVEAGRKRELSKNVSKNGADFGQLGDAAKLREALVQAELFVGNIVRHGHQTLVPGDKCTACDGAEELRDMICAALAAPATTEKSSAVGDAAKLREALDESRRIASGLGGCRLNDYWKLNEIVRVCEAALAAPARNCDKYATADEALKAQEQMFNDSIFANGECKLGCPECDNPRVGCKIAWLLAPATEKEGGDK